MPSRSRSGTHSPDCTREMTMLSLDGKDLSASSNSSASPFCVTRSNIMRLSGLGMVVPPERCTARTGVNRSAFSGSAPLPAGARSAAAPAFCGLR